MISAFTNTFKVPELRNRVLLTLLLLIVCRIGAWIPCPGVDATVIQASVAEAAKQAGGASMLFNIFTGGALSNCAIFSLGVMPYISASIMFQLLTAVIPQLSKLSKEDGGRQKIMQYTRYATIALCIFQGYLLALSFANPGPANAVLPGLSETIARLGRPLVVDPGLTYYISAVITMTAGTMFLMWVGDQITDRGIGNGMSMIIAVGIVAQLPAALTQAYHTLIPSAGQVTQAGKMAPVVMIAFFLLVIAGVICVTQGQRKVPVQYAKRVVGRKVYGGQTQYMPLKVNYAGVMPIIFAQALLVFPAHILNLAFKNSEMANKIAHALTQGWAHYVFYGVMIFGFSFFWVATQFQPQNIADDLKKYGGYIPGVRPGKATADFLNTTMNRLTFAGAVFLTVIAVLPQLVTTTMGIPAQAASFFGGTSLLIVVGVMLDTMRQVETHLIQRHYDGFLRKGKSSDRSPEARVAASRQGALVWAYVAAAVFFVAIMVILLTRGTH